MTYLYLFALLVGGAVILTLFTAFFIRKDGKKAEWQQSDRVTPSSGELGKIEEGYARLNDIERKR